jgi:hypothetical protein
VCVAHHRRLRSDSCDSQTPGVRECGGCEGRSSSPLHSRSVRGDELNSQSSTSIFGATKKSQHIHHVAHPSPNLLSQAGHPRLRALSSLATSPTALPGKAGSTWPSSSICSPVRAVLGWKLSESLHADLVLDAHHTRYQDGTCPADLSFTPIRGWPVIRDDQLQFAGSIRLASEHERQRVLLRQRLRRKCTRLT